MITEHMARSDQRDGEQGATRQTTGLRAALRNSPNRPATAVPAPVAQQVFVNESDVQRTVQSKSSSSKGSGGTGSSGATRTRRPTADARGVRSTNQATTDPSTWRLSHKSLMTGDLCFVAVTREPASSLDPTLMPLTRDNDLTNKETPQKEAVMETNHTIAGAMVTVIVATTIMDSTDTLSTGIMAAAWWTMGQHW